MSDATRLRLSAQDASFLERPADGCPLNVGGLIRLAPTSRPLSLERVRTAVRERLASLPRLRQRAVETPAGLGWDEDPQFSVEHHVDALGTTSGDRSLLHHVAALHATALDPCRPLWRLSLVPADETIGPALLFRASHALVDGMSSMRVMRALFDPTAGSPPQDRRPPPSAEAATSGEDPPDDASTVVGDLWQTLRPRHRRDLEPEQYDRALVLLDGWMSMLARGWHGGPRFASDAPVRTRIAVTELESAAVRRMRVRGDVRFDVVGLTITAAAISRLFTARGDDRETRIRTLVPVAASGGARRDDLGNRASFLLVTIPVGEMKPLERLAQIEAEVHDALAAGQHRAAAMSMRALETAPRDSVAAISTFTKSGHFVDLVVSCVPGSRRPLTFDGIAHELTHAILPITPQMRVAVGFADIAGRLGVAVTADEHVLPEAEFFADAIRRASAALVAAAPG